LLAFVRGDGEEARKRERPRGMTARPGNAQHRYLADQWAPIRLDAIRYGLPFARNQASGYSEAAHGHHPCAEIADP
jgi:hypothetical protein